MTFRTLYESGAGLFKKHQKHKELQNELQVADDSSNITAATLNFLLSYARVTLIVSMLSLVMDVLTSPTTWPSKY